tara:strand:- start:307 stop:687 length:381 start_codon:yes stop_codon:yes gene_type:complete
MELELMATNAYIKALLGQAQNVRPSTSINIAKGIGTVGRFALKRHPIGFGMLTAASILGSKYFDDEEEGIEPTPAREDYLATLNNKFSDEELEEFQKGVLTGYRPVLPWNQKANQVQNINQWNKDN